MTGNTTIRKSQKTGNSYTKTLKFKNSTKPKQSARYASNDPEFMVPKGRIISLTISKRNHRANSCVKFIHLTTMR